MPPIKVNKRVRNFIFKIKVAKTANETAKLNQPARAYETIIATKKIVN